MTSTTHDSDYFQRRAVEARVASFSKGRGEQAAIAGELALAYAALARRHASADAEDEPVAMPPAELA